MTPRSVTHREVSHLIAQGAQIVDVLPGHEYRGGHIRGAIHLPLARLWRDAGRVLKKDAAVIVYCRDSL
jgi:rhodanese-related sulfurtransferase